MSTPTMAPNCTSIGKYWTTLEENALAIQSYQTDLGYLALVISNNEFLDSNGNTSFEESTNLDLTLLNPTEVVSTRTSAENVTVLPYTAVATIRAFIFAQQEFIWSLDESVPLECFNPFALRLIITENIGYGPFVQVCIIRSTRFVSAVRRVCV